jgi:hypothetical protein
VTVPAPDRLNSELKIRLILTLILMKYVARNHFWYIATGNSSSLGNKVPYAITVNVQVLVCVIPITAKPVSISLHPKCISAKDTD